jgi:hypothetical protein
MGQRTRWVLPEVVDPPGHICFKIEVPNDRNHIAAFIGAIFSLSTPYSWQNDDAHTAIDVGKVWRKIWFDLQRNNCDCPNPETLLIEELDYQMSLCEQLRFQDGKLQALCCGVWEDITGQPPQGIGGGSQPGTSPQPTPGGCQIYNGDMGGAAPWYVPTVVSTSDTLDLSNMSGLFYDAFESKWFTPQGFYFVIAPTPIQYFDAGSPLPSAAIGKLIVKIGSTYYDIQPGPFTVPAGHTNDTVQLLMNTPTPAGSGGNVKFDITVCNNTPASWTSVIDFTVTPGGVFPASPGAWVSGVGWTGTPSGPDNYVAVLQMALTSCIIDSWDIQYTAAGGAGADNEIVQALNAAPYGTPTGLGTGTHIHYQTVATVAAVTAMANSFNTGSGATNFAIEKWTINGHGPKPPELP